MEVHVDENGFIHFNGMDELLMEIENLMDGWVFVDRIFKIDILQCNDFVFVEDALYESLVGRGEIVPKSLGEKGFVSWMPTETLMDIISFERGKSEESNDIKGAVVYYLGNDDFKD
ncbi:hypothetical protein [Diaphorobacter caeni]|uniref:hypothetical protein n=1 Tax=Diaphorobacter caeni TaxID=2784387 RepID=UPI00188F78FD|nr:hypothetical protein [Diaphorobacter caeni]MBF5006794.1 hypothetical protein [Diaphorobacter caeni]